MTCPKCQGRMVVDDACDPQSSAQVCWIKILRCINCGRIIEQQMELHKVYRPEPTAKKERRRVRKEL